MRREQRVSAIWKTGLQLQVVCSIAIFSALFISTIFFARGFLESENAVAKIAAEPTRLLLCLHRQIDTHGHGTLPYDDRLCMEDLNGVTRIRYHLHQTVRHAELVVPPFRSVMVPELFDSIALAGFWRLTDGTLPARSITYTVTLSSRRGTAAQTRTVTFSDSDADLSRRHDGLVANLREYRLSSEGKLLILTGRANNTLRYRHILDAFDAAGPSRFRTMRRQMQLAAMHNESRDR